MQMVQEAEMKLFRRLYEHPSGMQYKKLRDSGWWNRELAKYEYDRVRDNIQYWLTIGA